MCRDFSAAWLTWPVRLSPVAVPCSPRHRAALPASARASPDPRRCRCGGPRARGHRRGAGIGRHRRVPRRSRAGWIVTGASCWPWTSRCAADGYRRGRLRRRDPHVDKGCSGDLRRLLPGDVVGTERLMQQLRRFCRLAASPSAARGRRKSATASAHDSRCRCSEAVAASCRRSSGRAVSLTGGVPAAVRPRELAEVPRRPEPAARWLAGDARLDGLADALPPVRPRRRALRRGRQQREQARTGRCHCCGVRVQPGELACREHSSDLFTPAEIRAMCADGPRPRWRERRLMPSLIGKALALRSQGGPPVPMGGSSHADAPRAWGWAPTST